jgi:hypothetical protein
MATVGNELHHLRIERGNEFPLSSRESGNGLFFALGYGGYGGRGVYRFPTLTPTEGGDQKTTMVVWLD